MFKWVYKDTKEERERRINTYGCDGMCYGCNTYLPKGDKNRKEMCPRAEYCNETRAREFIGTMLACLFIIIGIPLLIFLLGWIMVS